MIEVGVVKLSNIDTINMSTLLKLGIMHWEELHKGNAPSKLNHNKEFYIDMEEAGKLYAVIAIDDDDDIPVPIGYSINMLMRDSLQPKNIIAHNYGLFVHPAYRGCNIGRQLILSSIAHAKELNCTSYSQTIPIDNFTAAKAAMNCGMQKVEEVYTQRF